MLTHKGTKTIKTDRLILRKFTINDAQAMFETGADDERVTRFLTWGPHGNIDITKFILNDWCTSYEKPDFYNWAIEIDGKIIGNVSCVELDDHHELCEIGYCIGYDFWGKGIVSEAVKAVTDYLINEIGFNRLEIKHAVKNPASGKVAQKCGYKYEGTKRHSFKTLDGEFLDISYYSILKSDIKNRGELLC